MSNQTHNPDATPADPAAVLQAALLRQVETLDQLAVLGLELARAITTRAIEANNPTDAAMSFSRVARAVRMTGLVQARLIGDMDETRRRDAFVSTHDREAAEEEQARLDPAYNHKARVENIVARVARAQDDNEDRIDRIINETAERLDDDDIYGDVLTRPVGELVALICRDLELAPDWGRLSEEAWAKKEMAAGLMGSPFLPLPPSAEEVRREGDAGPRLNAQRIGHPHPQPFPHQAGREQAVLSG